MKSEFYDTKADPMGGTSPENPKHKGMSWKTPFVLLWRIMKFVARYPYVFLVVLIAVAAIVLTKKISHTSDVHIEHTAQIGSTLTRITRIKAIGQWEALHLSCEEMADTLEEHLLGNKNLVKIYRGTMIIGVDLDEAGHNWFTTRGDTAVLRLPRAKLLNPEFIDEARTRTFYEKGHWNADVNIALYHKARRGMLRRNLTPQTLATATRNIEAQFESMFLAFGYKAVEFVPTSSATGQKAAGRH